MYILEYTSSFYLEIGLRNYSEYQTWYGNTGLTSGGSGSMIPRKIPAVVTL
jgi:hypothetical protein